MRLQIATICACSCEEYCNCGKTLGSVAKYTEEINTKDSGFYKKALFLSYFTLGYNFLEGLISVFAGLLAGSIALVGFGLDSFIESFYTGSGGQTQLLV